MRSDTINRETAYLILANGEVFKGKSFGASGSVIGETVFTTAMTGYEETLTDPSYCGQIVTQTFPLIGNYGVNDNDMESDGSCVSGYVVREFCEKPSNFRCEGDIESFLIKHGIIGLYGIDTRRLTRMIRETGVMNGMITTDEVTKEYVEKALPKIKSYTVKAAVERVSTKKKCEYKAEHGRFRVALMDYGFKANILRELLKRNCDVTVFPQDTAAEEIKRFAPDGIMLSNGPGDPEENTKPIETLKVLMNENIPIFGICLGHQLLALANGARTVKLKYGHRGANQPVTDLSDDRTYITSQNHGYAVVSESLPKNICELSHINANDKTCEGIVYRNAPAFTVQFHPEACGGPHDTSYLFDRFIELMEGRTK